MLIKYNNFLIYRQYYKTYASCLLSITKNNELSTYGSLLYFGNKTKSYYLYFIYNKDYYIIISHGNFNYIQKKIYFNKVNNPETFTIPLKYNDIFINYRNKIKCS